MPGIYVYRYLKLYNFTLNKVNYKPIKYRNKT